MIQRNTILSLQQFEEYRQSSSPLVERIFDIIFIAMLGLFLGFGYYLYSIKPAPQTISEKMIKVKTQFLIQEKKRVVKPQKKPEVKKIEPQKEEIKQVKQDNTPIDLTTNPVMNSKVDDIQSSPATGKRVQRVYGLRRVYSKGIGAGGSFSDAVIGKLGNTLNKEFDTITATKQEIKGQLVSTTTVTTAPSFKKRVKPEYTQEMLDNKVEGVIKVRVLVDIDGMVKKAIALDDLGYGSKDLAVKACFEMLFEPAMRVNEPVAVWIIIPIRFVLLG